MAAANLMQAEGDALIAMEKRRGEGFGDNDVRGVFGWISPHGALVRRPGNAGVSPAQGCEAPVNKNAGETPAFPGRPHPRGRARERHVWRKPHRAHAS